MRVQQEGGTGLTWVEQLETRAHVESLTQYIEAEITLSSVGTMRPPSVRVMLDSDFGVRIIPAEILTWLQRQFPDFR